MGPADEGVTDGTEGMCNGEVVGLTDGGGKGPTLEKVRGARLGAALGKRCDAEAEGLVYCATVSDAMAIMRTGINVLNKRGTSIVGYEMRVC